jgi:hypothetical protein
MPLILLTQTNASGNRLQFGAISWPSSLFAPTLGFRALYPSGGSGITVIIANLNPGDERQMRLENLTSQVPNNAWGPGDFPLFRYDPSGLFVFLGVIPNPAPFPEPVQAAAAQPFEQQAAERAALSGMGR